MMPVRRLPPKVIQQGAAANPGYMMNVHVHCNKNTINNAPVFSGIEARCLKALIASSSQSRMDSRNHTD